MTEENIEVEIRSFVTKEKYEELLEFFKKNTKFVKEDFQETHYFDCEQDLRIQKNNKGSKIWLKKGELHDDAREEIEILPHRKIKKIISKTSRNLFNALGL